MIKKNNMLVLSITLAFVSGCSTEKQEEALKFKDLAVQSFIEDKMNKEQAFKVISKKHAYTLYSFDENNAAVVYELEIKGGEKLDVKFDLIKTNDGWDAKSSSATTQLENTEEIYSLISNGINYYNKENYLAAISNFESASKYKNEDSQLYLGVIYANALGVKRNYSYAEELFRNSYFNSDEYNYTNKNIASYNLGLISFFKKDYTEAFGLFRLSASLLNKSAMYNLGVMYENGYGTSKNKNIALKKFTDACSDGHKKACVAYERLSLL